MADYRVYFLDSKGAIQAREEFRALNDLEACSIIGVVADACSEEYCGFEIWNLARRVFSTRAPSPAASLSEMSRSRQEQVLSLEDVLQRSRWRVAKSKRLVEKQVELRALLVDPPISSQVA